MSTIATTLTGKCTYCSPNEIIAAQLAVAVLKIPKASLPSVFTLAENSIVAKLDDGNTATALGVIFRVNLGEDMVPAILTGMRMDDGLVLPPGCQASRLDGYTGSVSDLRGSGEIVLAIAFDPKVHGHVASLGFSDLPNLQLT